MPFDILKKRQKEGMNLMFSVNKRLNKKTEN